MINLANLRTLSMQDHLWGDLTCVKKRLTVILLEISRDHMHVWSRSSLNKSRSFMQITKIGTKKLAYHVLKNLSTPKHESIEFNQDLAYFLVSRGALTKTRLDRTRRK